MPKFLFFLTFLFLAAPAFADDNQSISLFTSGQNHFKKNEFSLALTDWQKAADEGDTRAMDKLGEMYANGAGVKLDYAKALKYWHQAADKGDADAMGDIALSYINAQGVPQDRKLFMNWFHQALDYCNEHAAVEALLGEDAPDKDKAVDCLKKNAEAGNYRAMMNLASKDASGQYVLKNPLESVSWGHTALDVMQRKADAGDTQAMYYMGRAFFTGVGESIPQNADRGLKLCEKAGSLGDTDAMKWLLSLYLTNDQYKDYDKAALWNKKLMAQYTEKAGKGDVDAMVRLADKYYSPPTGVGADMGKPIEGAKKDADKAVVWAKKAASLGSREALTMLGYIYEDTNNNPLHDCKKAKDYYTQAAALGDLNAIGRMGARAKGATFMSCKF